MYGAYATLTVFRLMSCNRRQYITLNSVYITCKVTKLIYASYGQVNVVARKMILSDRFSTICDYLKKKYNNVYIMLQ